MIIDEVMRLIAKRDEILRKENPAEANRLIAQGAAFRASLAPEDLQWHYLTIILHDMPEGKTVVGRLDADPWKHPDPRVVEMWNLITDPANENVLKRRYDQRHNFNDYAKRTVEEAWKHLQARKQGRQGAIVVPITFEQARRIAQEKIGPDCGLLESETLEKPYGWCFFSQSKKYLESGKFEDALIGQGGFLVEKAAGRIFQFWSGQTLDRDLEEYEACSKYEIYEGNDLTITHVQDMRRTIDLLLKLEMTYAIPEEENGVIWRIPRKYTEEELRQALKKQPCRFVGHCFRRSYNVFEEIERSGCCRYELTEHVGPKE